MHARKEGEGIFNREDSFLVQQFPMIYAALSLH